LLDAQRIVRREIRGRRKWTGRSLRLEKPQTWQSVLQVRLKMDAIEQARPHEHDEYEMDEDEDLLTLQEHKRPRDDSSECEVLKPDADAKLGAVDGRLRSRCCAFSFIGPYIADASADAHASQVALRFL
jgi:hypothetical protein